MALLRIDSLSFAYPRAAVRALDGVSFTMQRGEYVVLCGSSGCGKTTLLRHIKPAMTPAGAREGKIYFNDISFDDLDEDTAAMKIGYVQQDPNSQIVTDFVWQELAFGLENQAVDTNTIRRRVSEMASFFGIEDQFHKKTSELSGGQKQILNLASILVMNPELLVLDEPTSMLDPVAARNLLELILRINTELGVSIIMCEHRLENVFPSADKILWMEKGRLVASDSPKNIASRIYTESDRTNISEALPCSVQIFTKLQQMGKYPADYPAPLTVREARKEIGRLLDHKPASIPLPEVKEQNDTVLSGKELWFRYEAKSPDILKGLSISLHDGEILSLVGGNGTGKSTLLRVLSGLSKPLRGKVKTADNKKVGLLPQSPQALFVFDSLYEDLYDAAHKDKEKVLDIAERFELSDKLYMHPYDLSGGEIQRSAIAKILLTDADVLLLDEPTKGLDAYLKKKLCGLLKSLKERGISILLVTHDLDFAAAVSDECAMIFDGQIISNDEPHRFFKGNRFYTTDAGLIAGPWIENAVLTGEITDVLLEKIK